MLFCHSQISIKTLIYFLFYTLLEHCICICFCQFWVTAKMSMPLVQQAPPMTVTQQPYNNNNNNSSHPTHASIGPVIAVLLVIIILGILAGMIGRLCTGRKIMGYGQYDIESWIETKCSSCIDGRIYPPPPPPRANNASASSTPASLQHQPQQEPKQDQSPQTSNT